MKLLLHFALMLAFTAIAGAADSQPDHLTGDWKSKAGSIVRVEPCGSSLCMRLVQILNSHGATTDSHNPEPSLRTRPLCDLQIGSGFTLHDPDHAVGGTLYDPKSGKTYRGNITAEGATLHLRGYIGIPLFGASEDWQRVADVSQTCSAKP